LGAVSYFQDANTAQGVTRLLVRGTLDKFQDNQTISSLGTLYPYQTTLRPDGDIAVGGWKSTPSGTLSSVLDENPASDADYVWTTSSGDVLEVALTDFPGYNTSATHTLRYRGKGAYTVYLMQGSATTIASWVHNDAITTEHSNTLTTQQIAQITNYNDLRIKIISG
jgi:hypothetical protein